MTRVKICGLMNNQDVDLCVEAGVHTLGFVVDFPVPVPWNLTKEKARELIDRVPPFVSTCLVTGGSVERVMAIAKAIRPNIIQLHYKETLPETAELANGLNQMGIKTIKALRLDINGKCDCEIPDPILAAQALERTNISALLVDSYTAARPGGTGVKVDLSEFADIRRAVGLPVIMAGGLNPSNVGLIIQKINPYAVDVLTGVEASPGRKDKELVYRFMQAVHEFNLTRL